MMAPEAPRPFPLMSAAVMEVSMVTGVLPSPSSSPLNVANNNLGGLLDMANTLWLFAHIQWYCNGNNPPADNKEGYKDAKPLGIITLVNAIKDMRALSIANVMGNRIGKEMLSKLQEIMRSKPNLISLCGIADDATEADLSGLNIDADDAIILASELSDKGALTKFDMSNNSLDAAGAKALAEGLFKGNQVMTELDLAGNALGLKDGNAFIKVSDMSGIVALADAILDMRAMTRLNISKNMLLTQEGGRALGNMLKANTILKELDISDSGNGMHSSQKDGSGFATAISEGLAGNGALTKFTFSGDNHRMSKPVTMETTMSEADFSGKWLGISGAIMFSAFLPECT
jgi:hypothetical protein